MVSPLVSTAAGRRPDPGCAAPQCPRASGGRPAAPDRRALPVVGAAGQRRDGHGVVGLRRGPAPPGGGEGAQGPAGHTAARGVRDARAHAPRGPRPRRALAPERDHGLRRRRRRRAADGRAGDGAVAQPGHAHLRAGGAVDGAGGGGRVRHRRGAARGAPGRDHPPRRQAGQRPRRPRRPGQAHRLRHRPQRGRRPDDDRRARARLSRLHRAGDRGGPARDARGGPVGARRDAVRRGRGPSALRRAGRPRLDDHRGGRRRGAPADGGRARSPRSSPR